MGGSLLYRSTYDRKCHIMAYRQSQVHVTGQLNPFLNEVDAGKTNFSMQWAWLSENVGSRRWWLSLTSRLVVGLPVVAESQNLTQLLVSNSQTKKIHKVFFFPILIRVDGFVLLRVMIIFTVIYTLPSPILFLFRAQFEILNDVCKSAPAALSSSLSWYNSNDTSWAMVMMSWLTHGIHYFWRCYSDSESHSVGQNL